jgi:ubiquinone/menaquinone biosynthesis C-methylase UbiE
MTDYPTLEDAWIWPDRVERLFREHATGDTLHICCGTSDVGDVTVDVDSDRDPDVVADMRELPFAPATFDTVICDPPWHHIQAVGKKHSLFFDALELLRPGGILLWNAYTVPTSEQAELEQLWVRQDYAEGRCSAIAKYRRYPGQTTLFDGEITDDQRVVTDGSGTR